MNQLSQLLQQLENKLPDQELVNQKVSASSVGWHIEHVLLTIDVITESLRTSNPDDYQWKFNFIRTLIFTINKIPRGKAQSPNSVRPAANFNKETLSAHIEATKEKIASLKFMLRNQYFVHPFFGKLNLKPAIKFLEIHTRHHLHIMNDILGK